MRGWTPFLVLDGVKRQLLGTDVVFYLTFRLGSWLLFFCLLMSPQRYFLFFSFSFYLISQNFICILHAFAHICCLLCGILGCLSEAKHTFACLYKGGGWKVKEADERMDNSRFREKDCAHPKLVKVGVGWEEGRGLADRPTAWVEKRQRWEQKARTANTRGQRAEQREH